MTKSNKLEELCYKMEFTIAMGQTWYVCVLKGVIQSISELMMQNKEQIAGEVWCFNVVYTKPFQLWYGKIVNCCEYNLKRYVYL